MKNGEMLNKRLVISNLPLVFEGRELPSKLQAKVILMRVTFDRAANSFNEKMKEVMNGLKPEGFDDIAREKNECESIESKLKSYEEWNGEGEKPSKPSEEELSKVKKFKEEKLDDYNTKEKDLLSKYNEAYMTEFKEESDVKVKKFTEDELASIIELIGIEGDFEFVNGENKILIPRQEYLAIVADSFVE